MVATSVVDVTMNAPAGVKAEAAAATDAAPSLVISNLNYAYPMGEKIIKDFSLTLPPGSRCLLSGANGAGKTTLLQVLAGKTMVPTEDVRVIGRPPFHDTELTCSGDLAYLGAQSFRVLVVAIVSGSASRLIGERSLRVLNV